MSLTVDLSAPDSEAILRWITTKGIKVKRISCLINGFIHQLNHQGFGLFRCAVLVKTLHPQIEMIYYSWKPSDLKTSMKKSHFAFGSSTYNYDSSVVEKTTYQHGSARGSDGFKSSPFKRLDDGEKWIHCPLDPAAQHFDFPILKELSKIGATDYFAASLITQSDDGAISNQISWSTNKPGGFTPQEIRTLKQVADCFAMCLEMHLNRHITETLLSVYLGEHSGKNVLNGKIQRGDVEVLDAAIWFSDLRGFTQMSGNVDSETLVGWLNEYFETVSKVILQNNGEILKFVGDAVLAIFPIHQPAQRNTICAGALDAAREANQALQTLNESRESKGLPPLSHGIALHEGDVQYGNIGALQRLDFTVIGQAVNLTSRLEGLCSSLKLPIVVSEIFASRVDNSCLQLAGEFTLKGMEEKQKVFGVKA